MSHLLIFGEAGLKRRGSKRGDEKADGETESKKKTGRVTFQGVRVVFVFFFNPAYDSASERQ